MNDQLLCLLRIIGILALVAIAVAAVRSVHWFPAEEVLTVWVYGSPQEAELYRKVAAEYQEQNPEVRLRLEVVPGRSVLQKVLTGMDAGHAPDVCVLHWRQMAQVASSGQLLPLEDLARRDGIDLDEMCAYAWRCHQWNLRGDLRLASNEDDGRQTEQHHQAVEFGTHGLENGSGAEAKGQMQRAARGGDVVYIARGTGDMEHRGVMGKGLCNAHAETSSRLVA